MESNNYRLDSDHFFKKILIVEDVTYLKRLLKKEFKDLGYFVLTAQKGEEAIKKAYKYSPDIVTLSHDLKDMTIIQFLERIKSICDTKILFLSSRGDKDHRTKDCKDLISSVISLPIDSAELENKLYTFLSSETSSAK